MYPAAVAEQLRRHGYDAVAVTERTELRSLADYALLAFAQEQRRALVTENVADFAPLADQYDQRRQSHYGLILVDPRKFPRGRQRTAGRVVAGLRAILDAYRDDKPSAVRLWL
jgi:uncharacterized protein DUF5615